VLHEHGTPSFIAIDVHDYQTEVTFYRQVFGWDPIEEVDSGHHYAGYMDPENRRPIAGIGDEVESLAPGESPHWSVVLAKRRCRRLGRESERARRRGAHRGRRPWARRVARVADPSGAPFWLFRPKG